MTVAPIDAERVGERVERLGLDWHYRDSTGSTNADALRLHAETPRDLVVFAEQQSAGRGRRGREWRSPPAHNIYCTVGLARELPPPSQGLLSLVTALALRAALKNGADVDVDLKWPNDLLHDGRKLGGILIESRTLDAGRFLFAIGFGINVHMPDAELAALDVPATSVAAVAPRPVDRGEILLAALAAVTDAVRGFDPADAARWIAEFERSDAFHGGEIEIVSGDERIRGTYDGIDPDGRLRLATADGIARYAAAEISLRTTR